jgi:hypothetical protein
MSRAHLLGLVLLLAAAPAAAQDAAIPPLPGEIPDSPPEADLDPLGPPPAPDGDTGEAEAPAMAMPAAWPPAAAPVVPGNGGWAAPAVALRPASVAASAWPPPTPGWPGPAGAWGWGGWPAWGWGGPVAGWGWPGYAGASWGFSVSFGWGAGWGPWWGPGWGFGWRAPILVVPPPLLAIQIGWGWPAYSAWGWPGQAPWAWGRPGWGRPAWYGRPPVRPYSRPPARQDGWRGVIPPGGLPGGFAPPPGTGLVTAPRPVPPGMRPMDLAPPGAPPPGYSRRPPDAVGPAPAVRVTSAPRPSRTDDPESRPARASRGGPDLAAVGPERED